MEMVLTKPLSGTILGNCGFNCLDLRLKEVTFKRHKIEGVRQIGLLTGLPFIMLGGPLVGYFAGNWLDKKAGTDPYLTIALIILGCIASARESVNLIRRANERDDHEDNRRT